MKDKFPYVIVLELCRFRCERDGQSLHQGVLRPVSSKTLALHQSTAIRWCREREASNPPVLSITCPKTRGETIAASAEPVFIRPLAEPENRGAMSIGIAHMGPIVNLREEREAQKNGHHVRLCNRRIGSIEATEQTKPATTRFRRAFLRSPVLSKIRSLTTPPSVLPSTPARKTPAEKSAELFRLSR